jgi:hypothetical protein
LRFYQRIDAHRWMLKQMNWAEFVLVPLIPAPEARGEELEVLRLSKRRLAGSLKEAGF